MPRRSATAADALHGTIPQGDDVTLLREIAGQGQTTVTRAQYRDRVLAIMHDRVPLLRKRHRLLGARTSRAVLICKGVR